MDIFNQNKIVTKIQEKNSTMQSMRCDQHCLYRPTFEETRKMNKVVEAPMFYNVI